MTNVMKVRYVPWLLILPIGLAAQNRDKAKYQEHKPGYYGKIKKGIEEYEKSQNKHSAYKTFKMDVSGIDKPQSLDEFTTVWCQNPISQGNTGTCWCFSTSSFYESEIFRLTKQKIKLSELYTVYWEYVEKAREYVRTRGKSFFGEGSETNAVARMMARYGCMPESAYNGMKEGQLFHNHEGMFKEMSAYLNGVKAANAWNEDDVTGTIKAIMNHYIGTPSQSFDYNGKTYTPVSFMKDVAKLHPEDYVNFMSLMYAPYYHKAVYKVPDNWWNSDNYYNVPLDDFMLALKSAIKNGYSVSLGGDVSEPGLVTEEDIAVVPSFDIPGDQIDQYAREMRFKNGATTDDHAIHVIGYCERNGFTWLLIKDSGSGSRNGTFDGYLMFREDYVKLKMMTFTTHKDAVKDLLKQCRQ